jgi:NAD(P)H-hydrate repair Nnr-like enzyme with NAD(P)H-hydrate dehydratase domain
LERPAVFDADALNALAEAGVFDETQTLETRELEKKKTVAEGTEKKAAGEKGGEQEKKAKNAAPSNCFAGRKPRGARILTPHPGEFARLTGAKPTGDRAARIDAATAFAARLERLFGDGSAFKSEERKTTQVPLREALDDLASVGDSAFVVALKGAGTVVADGSGAAFVNETGNPNLATGGSGDVLTGVVVGLLAQGAPPLDATRSAVALCGLAADLRATLCSRGAVASDVIRFLPVAFDFYEAAQASARRAF